MAYTFGCIMIGCAIAHLNTAILTKREIINPTPTQQTVTGIMALVIGLAFILLRGLADA